MFDTETQDYGERMLRNWKEFSLANTSKKRDPKKVWEEIRVALSSGKHNEVCDRLKLVFELMGFEVHKHYEEKGEPDLEVISTTRARYVCIVEVKTKDEWQGTSDKNHALVGREAVDQIGGHRPKYQLRYSDRPVFPVLFTNKEGFSETALSKAASTVRLLRSSEFSSFLLRFYDLMERGWKAENQYDRIMVMSKIPLPDEYQAVLNPKQIPVVAFDELEGLVKW